MNPQFRSLLALAFLMVPVSPILADDWPQWLGPKRDSVWRESGILEKFPDGGPKILWRKPVAWGYTGPAVADGRVFVMDFVTKDMPKPNAVKKPKVPGTERILCFRAVDGKLLWKQEYEVTYEISYPAGPRATPTVDAGKVYTLGAEGKLLCLDAAKGSILWSKDFKKEYNAPTPFWGHCAHPLVVDDKLICLVGGEGSVAVAFDKNTGKEIWKALSAKNQGYCPPTLIEAGGQRQLIIWHGESINSLNPDMGQVHWSIPFEPAYGMSIVAPRQLGDNLFAAGIMDKAVLLKLATNKPAADVVWRGTPKTALYPVSSTPFLEDGHIYGADRQGEFRCVKLENGERIWETFAPTTGKGKANSGTAFIVKNGDRFFLASETGDLIIAKLSPEGYKEISRWHMLEPTGDSYDRPIVWSHPAFANRCAFARNDREIICVSLAR